MSIRRCLPAFVLIVLPLSACTTDSNRAAMGQMAPKPMHLTLGAGDTLGVQIYAADLALAVQATERNPLADVRYQPNEQR